MKSSRSNGMQIRLACDCDALSSPDPWLIAGDDVNLDRLAETRSYRQSKFRT